LRPSNTEYASFYAGYVGQITEEDVLPVLEEQIAQMRQLAETLPADKEGYRYAPGKWSVREVVGHLTDAERVFGYRALCIGRGDQTPLPGFDENAYMETAGFDQRTLADLVDELAHVRRANLAMLRHLGEDGWARVGTANANPISVRALAYIMAGHLRHHLNVLRERYGVEF
jgi:hypothetical protein